MIEQINFKLPSFPKGYHIITSLIEAGLPNLPDKGLINIFIHHTSAGLSINENADPSVRDDFESFLNKLIPEDDPVYKHIFEGSDDMPAHLKSSLIGQSVSIPVTNGKLSLGTWQGIYLCEFRRHGGQRKVTVTLLT
ncbi:MAG: secondary thiamine-phosphate synthase enzyme YjbQ [Bacteroidales bacterium]|nr:secondary thiamine-phosphate synthase enzyme YjbQ [Bacteroidales bacterium]